MPTPVTGNLRDLTGSASASGLSVRFTLQGTAGQQPRVSGTGVIAPEKIEFHPNASGVISGTLYSTRDAAGTGNGEIEVGGSLTSVWYKMEVFVNGIPQFPIPCHAKNGATLDISSVVSLNTAVVPVAPTGDTTYARLDGGNTPFTAIIQFLQGILLALGKSVAWGTDLFLGRGAAGKLTVGSTAGASDGTVSAATYQVGGVSQSGTGPLAGTVSPVLTTPNIGVATATSVNKVAITQPATGATITVPDGTTQTFPSTSQTLVGRTSTDTLTGKALQGAGSGNAVTLLNSQDTLGNLTGNGTDQTVYTFTIPANTIQAGKGIRLRFHALNNNAAVVTYKVKLGTTLLVTAPTGAASNNNTLQVEIFNNAGVQTAQRFIGFGFDGTAILMNSTGAVAENTANALALTVTASESNPNTITPSKWLVELIQ